MPTSSTILRSSVVALSLAVPLVWVASARADVTCGDQTCPKNYECATENVACPEIACAPDDKGCVPCSGTTQYCSPLPCASDADCADDMVCYTQSQQVCDTTTACDAGQKCPPPSDPTCTTQQVSACVPRYLVPCQADADCGVGFTCEMEQSCTCASGSGTAGSGSASSASSGSASSGSADGGTPTPAPAPSASGNAPNQAPPADSGSTPSTPPPDCNCAPSGTKTCNLTIVACSADQGCPAGWTCGDNPNGACSVSSDGQSSCTADPPKICLPPYFTQSLGGPAGHAGGLDTSGSGTTTGAPATGNAEAPSTPTKDAATSSTSDGASGGGCSVVEPRSSRNAMFGFAALALAGVFGLRRRRAAR